MIILNVLDKIFMIKTKREDLFKHYFNWMKITDPKYLSMLDYNTFLGTCNSIELLKEHKDYLIKYKY